MLLKMLWMLCMLIREKRGRSEIKDRLMCMQKLGKGLHKGNREHVSGVGKCHLIPKNSVLLKVRSATNVVNGDIMGEYANQAVQCMLSQRTTMACF